MAVRVGHGTPEEIEQIKGSRRTAHLKYKVAVWGKYKATEGYDMREKLKRLWNRFFDYKIVGEYYDTSGDGHYYKKYVKRWRLRK